MSGSIKNIIKKSLNPFIGVGAVCMLCSGIWLIAAGYWYALWPASMAFIFSAFIFPMLILPASFFAGMMMATEKMYPRVSLFFQTCSVMWLVTLMAGYTTLSLSMAQGYFIIEPAITIPAVIWAIAAAVTPWAFFATRDRESVFFTGLVYVTGLVAALLFPWALERALDMVQIFWLFWLALGALVGLQALYEKYLHKPAVPAAAPAPEKTLSETAPTETSKPE